MMEINCSLSIEDEEELKRVIRIFSEIEKEYSCNCTLNLTVFTHQYYEVFDK